MSRPRLTIGTYGDIGYQAASSGRMTAYARYRDWDGMTRVVQATAQTQKAAERALKAKLAERTLYQPTAGTLTPDSPFEDLVAYWLADLDLDDRLSPSTRQLYERNMRTLVTPAFRGLTLREIGVARCDQFLKHLSKQSYNRARQARVSLRLAFALAVRHEVLPRNPLDHVGRLRKPPHTPDALPAVGRGGVLETAIHARGRSYDMTELHRCISPEYAALTLTMRDRENPDDVFDKLAAMGLVTLHESEDEARDQITEQAQDGEVITVATNEEAAALNERIRVARVEHGEVDDTLTATGNDGLAMGAGDLIQARKNDTTIGVANRQQWIVRQITEDGTVYAREVGDRGKKALRIVALPPEYVAEHMHLSYAATAYGVQGTTVDTSHTILSSATSAAGVYVGMTRGRETNRLHVVAENLNDARAQFVAAMGRDSADRGLDHATQQAKEAVRGLIADGPVQRVNEAIARLTAEVEKAEQSAARWTQSAAKFDAQRAAHRTEREEHDALVREAKVAAELMRAEVTEPLAIEAEADGAAAIAASDAEMAATARLANAGRFGKRRARAEQRAATDHVDTVRAQVRADWGTEPPYTAELLPAWAARQAATRAERDPRVLDAARTVGVLTADGTAMVERQEQERRALGIREYGPTQARRMRNGMGGIKPHSKAREAASNAAIARREVEELRALPVTEAATRLDAQQAASEES
ncbi:hypothetical protein [Leucobacter chromiireducens]|uniref:hypothetical protein n=1 Tax=Leucobacter chromiireducens TaxID=283877 RepID=UPI000F63AA94|nr:hypothetical protein [Leucobacter chromiireducens]